MTKKFKVIFFSEINSKFGMPFFKKIIQDPHFEISAFVTTPAGRVCSYYVGEPNQVNLEAFAKENDIPVLRPTNIKTTEIYNKLKSYSPDYIIIANYQKILQKNLIDLPKYKALNFHPSPLPRYAGLAPFFWMAKQGEKNSGVSCIEVAPQVDGGEIVAQLPVVFNGNETSLEIRNRLFNRSLSLLDKVLESIVTGTMSTRPQDKKLRQYYGNPTIEDKTISEECSLREILATMRACAPHSSYLAYQNKLVPVNAFGYIPQVGTLPFKCQNTQLFFQSATPENQIL